jgi:heat shock protein 5
VSEPNADVADFVFSIKSQVNDPEGMGGKISEEDKKTILAAVKEKTEWLEENSSAEAEDYEDQLAEIQAIVAPISSKMYGGAGGAGGDDQVPFSHDEL